MSVECIERSASRTPRRIAKTHFAFCRVNIYIDTRRIKLEKEERNRILPFHESRMVAFTHSGSDEAAFNRATVYKNELLRLRLWRLRPACPIKPLIRIFGRTSARYLNQALQVTRPQINRGFDH